MPDFQRHTNQTAMFLRSSHQKKVLQDTTVRLSEIPDRDTQDL